jgi:hypothetical protein
MSRRLALMDESLSTGAIKTNCAFALDAWIEGRERAGNFGTAEPID